MRSLVLYFHILNSQNHESSDETVRHNYKDIHVYILFFTGTATVGSPKTVSLKLFLLFIVRLLLSSSKTEKGKGYLPAENSDDKFHGVNKFNIISGAPLNKTKSKSYSQIFGETLTNEAKKDDSIVAVTAAMASGTGLNIFSKHFKCMYVSSRKTQMSLVCG